MLKGGEVGGVIAANATAEIAMRLVKENSPRTMVDRVLAHIRKQGYFVVDKDPDTATLAAHPRIAKVTTRAGAASGAWRTDPDVPEARFVTDALRSRYGERLVRIRTLGGSVPADPFIDAFHVPTVGVSLANFDDNQHTDNENLRLGNLWNGIRHAGRNHDEVGARGKPRPSLEPTARAVDAEFRACGLRAVARTSMRLARLTQAMRSSSFERKHGILTCDASYALNVIAVNPTNVERAAVGGPHDRLHQSRSCSHVASSA